MLQSVYGALHAAGDYECAAIVHDVGQGGIGRSVLLTICIDTASALESHGSHNHHIGPIQ